MKNEHAPTRTGLSRSSSTPWASNAEWRDAPSPSTIVFPEALVSV